MLKSQVEARSRKEGQHRAYPLGVALGVACVLAMVAALWPVAAGGAAPQVVVLGQTTPVPAAACPQSPCEAVGSVTGFQAQAGSVAKPFAAPFNGKMVAWTITLSKPKASQQNFFNNFYGTPPEGRISVIRQVPDKSPPRYSLVSQGPLVNLSPYLGSTVTFSLDEPLNVKQGDIVALTIPTWAPAFAVGLTDSSGWRASRKTGKCTKTADIKESHPSQKIGADKQYGCFYKTARLLYTATLVKG